MAEIITREGYSEYCKTFIPRSFFFVAMIGFTFGYDIGLTGCLTSKPSFLKKFFPDAYENLSKSNIDSFLDDDVLNFYRSSSYLFAFVSSSIVVVPYQCQACLSFLFLQYVVAIEFAFGVGSIRRLITNRIMFGFGLGLAIQLAYEHISTMIPCVYRGRLIAWFQLAITIGILTPYLFCFVWSLEEIKYLWSVYRLLPFSVLYFSYIYSHRTSTATYSRCAYDQIQIPWSSIISERKYWMPLVVVVCISIFQQLTGIYAFMIYAPILFKFIGLSQRNSLSFSLIMCGINSLVAFFSFASVEKFGRRNLFIHGGFLMLACQIIITFIVGIQEEDQGVVMMSAIMMTVAICGYTWGCAWSWGPLGWLLPIEILPSEIQSVGERISVSVKMIFMFIVTRFFMIGFCKMMFHMCLLVLSLVLVMTIFACVFLPETKGVEVENILEAWKTHPYWKRYIVVSRSQ